MAPGTSRSVSPMRLRSGHAQALLLALGLGTASGAAALDPPRTDSSPEIPVTAQVRIEFSSSDGKPLSGKGFAVFQSLSSPDPLVFPATLPEPVTVGLPPGSQWTLIADFPGYFSANSVVQIPPVPGASPEKVQAILRPAGLLTGKFVVDEKERLPDWLEARFEPTRSGKPDQRNPPAGSAICAVGKEGDWRCRLPAGSLDIALYPRGFIPHYLWNTAVVASETGSAGTRKVVRGASVAGWISQEDGTPAEKCRVRLEPAVAPGRPNDPTLEFLRAVAAEAPCQKNGFFQFAAVAPGTYSIVAQERDAQAHMAPVEVWEGSESRISVPITLRRPVDFEVTLSPPVDWLGRPWRFEARRAVEYRSGWEEPGFRVEAGLDGRVTISRQTPGRFWLSVYDALGNAVYSDLHVELTDPAEPYPIELNLLWVEGQVKLGDEPVGGRLTFNGQAGAASVSMIADEEGRFSGPLPQPGTWRVNVESSVPRLRTHAQVEIRPKADRQSITIELPDTRVYGRVVDPAGAPAPGAAVLFSSMIGTLQTEADQKGEFEIRAFPRGALEISASRATGQGNREVSDSYRFEASEDAPHGPVVLTLRSNQTLRGKVVAATGPVIGATILAWSVGGGDGVASTVRSRLDGSFEVKVPAGTSLARIVVSPPGGALKAYEVAAANEAELLFQVEPLGGELLVDVGKAEAFQGRILALWQGDIGISMATLIRWSEGHGARFLDGTQIRIPQLAAGFYTVCLGLPAVVDPSQIEEWKKQGACDSGYLAAGSSLGLRLH